MSFIDPDEGVQDQQAHLRSPLHVTPAELMS